MTFLKTNTVPLTTTTQGQLNFCFWYFETYLPTKGWTVARYRQEEFAPDGTAVDWWWCFKREYTNKKGLKCNDSFIIEIELSGSSTDMQYYHWDGVNQETPISSLGGTFYSDTTMTVLNGSGVFTTWEDDQSDSFFLLKNNRPVGWQLPSNGMLSAITNTGNTYGGQRTYWMCCPFFDMGSNCMIVDNGSKNLWTGLFQYPSDNYNGNYYADLCIIAEGSSSLAPSAFFESQDPKWKMRTEAIGTNLWTWAVVKVGDEYYLNAGGFLLPAGNTEPEL